MKYTIVIRNNATGEERRYADDWPSEDEDVMEFCWTEGNYACDCNRRLFFLRAGGVEPTTDFDNDDECSSSAYSALYAERPDGSRIKLDGELLPGEKRRS